MSWPPPPVFNGKNGNSLVKIGNFTSSLHLCKDREFPWNFDVVPNVHYFYSITQMALPFLNHGIGDYTTAEGGGHKVLLSLFSGIIFQGSVMGDHKTKSDRKCWKWLLVTWVEKKANKSGNFLQQCLQFVLTRYQLVATTKPELCHTTGSQVHMCIPSFFVILLLQKNTVTTPSSTLKEGTVAHVQPGTNSMTQFSLGSTKPTGYLIYNNSSLIYWWGYCNLSISRKLL